MWIRPVHDNFSVFVCLVSLSVRLLNSFININTCGHNRSQSCLVSGRKTTRQAAHQSTPYFRANSAAGTPTSPRDSASKNRLSRDLTSSFNSRSASGSPKSTSSFCSTSSETSVLMLSSVIVLSVCCSCSYNNVTPVLISRKNAKHAFCFASLFMVGRWAGVRDDLPYGRIRTHASSSVSIFSDESTRIEKP